MYCFFGIFIISLFINKFQKGTFKLSFLHKNENEKITIKENDNSKLSFIIIFIIIILWIIEDPIIKLYKSNFTDLDFWMLELLILSYLNAKMFNEQIYKHHKLSIYINLIICMVKIIMIILSLLYKDPNNISLYIKYTFLIPILIIIYLVLITLRSYINIKLKTFFDIKYIDIIEILIIYGLLGTLINLIFCTITTFEKCNTSVKEYFCKVPYQGNDYIHNSSDLYLDSFSLYFKTLNGDINRYYSRIEILIEIFLVFLGIIINYIYKIFFFLVIRDLSPMHVIFSYSINNILPKLILPIYTLIYEGSFFSKNAIDNIDMKYTVGFFMNIFSLFSFSIYLEIIQLNCYGLDYNTKQSIDSRSDKEKNELLVPIETN